MHGPTTTHEAGRGGGATGVGGVFKRFQRGTLLSAGCPLCFNAREEGIGFGHAGAVGVVSRVC